MFKKMPTFEKIASNHHESWDSSNLIVLSAAGGLLGAFAAYWITKKNSKPAPSLKNSYHDFSHRVEQAGDSVIETGQNVYRTILDYAESLRENSSKILSPETLNSKNLLLLGGVSAAILGATSILLLSRKSCHPASASRRGSSFRDEVESIDWLEVAKEFTTALNARLSSAEGTSVNRSSTTFHDAIQLASLGVRLWDNIKKGS